MDDPFKFSPEERGFERVTDDDSDALYATDSSRDATGKVEREEFAARGTEDTGFYAQKVQRDESGKIVGKQTFGTKSDTRQEAVESVEAQVRNRTAANFGGFTIGEFNVGRESSIDQARQAHLSRTQEAKIADASKRAPITTDASRYVSQPGELDYPGVDTPTTDPQVLPKDLRQEQRPDTTDPDTQTVNNESATFDRGIVFSNTTKTESAERGVSPEPNRGLEPVETAGVTGVSDFEKDQMADGGVSSAGGAITGTTPQTVIDNLASGINADIAFVEAEEERSSGGGAVGDLVQGGSVPTRPYESRNDGPPSQVGPYELTQDRQNDDLRTVAFENEESDRSVVFQTYNTDLDGPEATVDVSFGDNIETVAEGDADEVYQQLIGELEERRDRNKERDPSDGSGIQGRAEERMSAAQQLFGGGQS